MGMRIVTDDEAELLFYLHYLSNVKYSISELTTLFGLSKRTVYNYLNQIKVKVEKDDSILARIAERFKGYESRKALKEEIEELNYTGTVKEIARKLIEIQKIIKSLIVLHQQPVNSNVNVVLQNMSGKVDKIPRNFATIGEALKAIIKMLQNQGNNNTDRLDDLNEKMDKVLACLNDLKNSQNSSGDSCLQPNLQSDDNGYNTKAVKF